MNKAIERKREEISDLRVKLRKLESELLALERKCPKGGEHAWDHENHSRSHITKKCQKCGKKEFEYMGGRRKSCRRKKRRRKKRSRRRRK